MRVYSEDHFVTNTGRRLGDMIRGRVGKATFELELVSGNASPDVVGSRVAWRAQALRATAEPPH